MKRIILVVGKTRQGKSYLAHRLVAEHAFVALSVDEAYINFVRGHCSMLYFEALHLYIGPHYNTILANRNYSRVHLDRDLVAEWRQHLTAQIYGLASLHDNVVVEGCLLNDYDKEFIQIVASSAPTFVVSVEDRRCFWQGEEFSVERVAALGSQTG